MNYETENIEFKSGFTEEIYKEVIAFANTAGGSLYSVSLLPVWPFSFAFSGSHSL